MVFWPTGWVNSIALNNIWVSFWFLVEVSVYPTAWLEGYCQQYLVTSNQVGNSTPFSMGTSKMVNVQRSTIELLMHAWGSSVSICSMLHLHVLSLPAQRSISVKGASECDCSLVLKAIP